jgi:hypothetical protein
LRKLFTGNSVRCELDALLGSLKTVQPPSSEMQKWKSAAREEASKTLHTPSVIQKHRTSYNVEKFPRTLQLVAAMLVGIIMGALLIKYIQPVQNSQEWMQNLGSNATFERTHTNLD